MIVSFTGTREGMSPSQRDQLGFVLAVLCEAYIPKSLEFRHGDADGADRQAALVALSFGMRVTAWPPRSTDASPLVRNERDLAAPCDLLIAGPRTDTEETRSGTWATVRYVRRRGKPILFLTRGKIE